MHQVVQYQKASALYVDEVPLLLCVEKASLYATTPR